jgi:glutathionyl-hydroquinone reductase
MRSTSNQLKRDQPSSPTLHENGAASIFQQWLAHASAAGQAEIAAYRPLAQRPLRQLAYKPLSQNSADLAHPHYLGRHLVPLLCGKERATLVENCVDEVSRYTPIRLTPP